MDRRFYSEGQAPFYFGAARKTQRPTRRRKSALWLLFAGLLFIDAVIIAASYL